MTAEGEGTTHSNVEVTFVAEWGTETVKIFMPYPIAKAVADAFTAATKELADAEEQPL